MWFKEKNNSTYARILLQATETTPKVDQNWKELLFPCFEVSKWDEKSYYQVFEWNFISIEEWSYHSDKMNKDVELVKIKFDCDWDIIVISGSRTGVMRNIVNSLAWCKASLWLISMWLYSKEYNGKDYANVWVKNNGERTEWLLDIEEQKKLKKIITDPDTKEVIKTKRDDMEKKLKDSFEKINKNVPWKKPFIKDEDIDLPF